MSEVDQVGGLQGSNLIATRSHPDLNLISTCSRLLIAAALAISYACSGPPPRPLQVQGNRLIVDNQSGEDWVDVEIWINQQYRITYPRIADGSRFTTTLDAFVAGFGQRFDVQRQRVNDLRLKAKKPDGTPVEIQLGAR